MATRTIQFYGQGYGTTPAEIAVTANGNTVFSGTIPTVDQPVPALPATDPTPVMPLIFSMNIEQSFTGFDNQSIPMTCTVTNGTVIFADILGNYSPTWNPAYTPAQGQIIYSPNSTLEQKVAVWTEVANPPLSQADIDALSNPATPQSVINTILFDHNLRIEISTGVDAYGIMGPTDSRDNVTIDSITQIPDHGNLPGTWWWKVTGGQTLGYDLDVPAPVRPQT